MLRTQHNTEKNSCKSVLETIASKKNFFQERRAPKIIRNSSSENIDVTLHHRSFWITVACKGRSNWHLNLTNGQPDHIKIYLIIVIIHVGRLTSGRLTVEKIFDFLMISSEITYTSQEISLKWFFAVVKKSSVCKVRKRITQ